MFPTIFSDSVTADSGKSAIQWTASDGRNRICLEKKITRKVKHGQTQTDYDYSPSVGSWDLRRYHKSITGAAWCGSLPSGKRGTAGAKSQYESNAPIPSDSIAYSAMIDALPGNWTPRYAPETTSHRFPGTMTSTATPNCKVTFLTSMPHLTDLLCWNHRAGKDHRLLVRHFGYEQILKLRFLNIWHGRMSSTAW